MADNDDFMTGYEGEEDDSGPPGTTLNKDDTVFDLLPRMLLEATIGSKGIADLKDRPCLCVVVRVPDETWVNPVASYLNTTADFDGRYAVRIKAKKTTDHPSVARYLAKGNRVFGVSQDPSQMLPPELLGAADLTIEMPRPNSAIVSAVVRELTQDDVVVPEADLQGLTFDDIATCIRRGSSGLECLGRLAALRGRKATAPVSVDETVPKLEDLVAYGEAKDWGTNLIADLAGWRRGEVAFEAIESRVILAGPPGVGKTTFAKSLARSSGLPLFTTSAADWFANTAGYLDSVIKGMNAVFEAAREKSPAIVFIDEADAIPSRAHLSRRNRDWWLPVIANALQLLDGSNPANRNLVIVMATNHVQNLDDALVRAGRMSKIIHVGLPTAAESGLILRQHLGNDLRQLDIERLTPLLAGRTGADVADLVKRARGAARRDGRNLSVEDLSAVLSPQDERPLEAIERIAIHEIGHALIGHLLGGGILRSVSIVPLGGTGGHTWLEEEGQANTRADVERRVIALLGGRAAEKVLLGSIGTGSGGTLDSDLGRATRLVAMLHASLGLGGRISFLSDLDGLPQLLARNAELASIVEQELEDLHARAEALIEQHSHLARVAADELVSRRYLSGDAFRDIVAMAGGHHAQH